MGRQVLQRGVPVYEKKDAEDILNLLYNFCQTPTIAIILTN